MPLHIHTAEAIVAATVGVAGVGAALLLQAGSPAGAADMARDVVSSIPDSFWITAAIVVAMKFVVSSQIKKLVELPPKQAIFEAIGNVEKLVKEYHALQMAAIEGLRKDGIETDKRVAVIEKGRELEAAISAALKPTKGTT